MTPLAAYYVMIATERELLERRPRYHVEVPRRSPFTRISDALATLLNLGRPASSGQPA